MMDYQKLPTDYLLAEGAQGLKQALEQLLEKAQQDREFAINEHYILYQAGNQKSLIKLDLSQKPYLFWYADLMGRPATEVVKETIARFLWDKCGEKDRYLQELEPR